MISGYFDVPVPADSTAIDVEVVHTGRKLWYQATRECDSSDVQINRTMTLHGWVLDEAGNPLENVKVQLDPSEHESGLRYFSPRTDADGRFRFEKVVTLEIRLPDRELHIFENAAVDGTVRTFVVN